jgi:acetyl-CoA carboxylase biotin carboxyl carrier protein
MTLEEIRELVKLVMETGVAELEVQRSENRVRIRRVSSSLRTDIGGTAAAAVPAGTSGFSLAPPGPATGAAPAAALSPAAQTEAELMSDPSIVVVKSPIVGTFYESPAPDAAPFVQPGDIVKPGQVLCIIESMKLMNEIESEVSGTIIKKLVQNAQPVEYGEGLFAIKPS